MFSVVPTDSSGPLAVNLDDINPNLDDTLPSEIYMYNIHRGNVLTELEQFFARHPLFNIRADTLIFSVILPNGDRELAKGDGVTHDILTEFWTSFYDRRCIGNEVKIPMLSPSITISQRKVFPLPTGHMFSAVCCRRG